MAVSHCAAAIGCPDTRWMLHSASERAGPLPATMADAHRCRANRFVVLKLSDLLIFCDQKRCLQRQFMEVTF